MAIPQVDLVTADSVKIRFIFQPCGFFSASLVSNTSGCDSLTVISDTARIQSSASSRFEVFFDKALFEFPHTELKKFKAFLAQVNAVKEAA
jgi:hypothetical protein